MKHRDTQLIMKIISECKDIIRYTNEIGEESFLENDIYQKATAMSLLNISEHANVLTRELWAEYPDIQWRKILDLRNIVAHGYGELRMELVWNLSQKEAPMLLGQLESISKED
ncbi:MAG TPA: HepT-like ribonuclease domain-containing protein [Patescibacteria group bacterium]|nr:HepT-like ribonuclease domain-containing protein [Patescibacteria group bacterium]